MHLFLLTLNLRMRLTILKFLRMALGLSLPLRSRKRSEHISCHLLGQHQSGALSLSNSPRSWKSLRAPPSTKTTNSWRLWIWKNWMPPTWSELPPWRPICTVTLWSWNPTKSLSQPSTHLPSRSSRRTKWTSVCVPNRRRGSTSSPRRQLWMSTTSRSWRSDRARRASTRRRVRWLPRRC